MTTLLRPSKQQATSNLGGHSEALEMTVTGQLDENEKLRKSLMKRSSKTPKVRTGINAKAVSLDEKL